ncbi:MAG: dehypoxanthine futalosine cyclase [Waddliaceae bacterium]|nr:dehypoxanthine futalosine cyclase [Waddliaceae bacterium]
MAQRISQEEGLRLFKEGSLEELKARAVEIRNEKNPANRVTFVVDSNPNYTNVCNADCKFCAFYRHKSAKDAYTKNCEEVMEHLQYAKDAGCTTVLLQGGLHPDLSLDYYTDLVRNAKARFPEINPHFFTAPEIYNCAKVSECSIRDVLQALYDAGQRSLPGGGAEIISERVRQQVSPKKMTQGAWIDIHKTAHQIGFRTTATMMYGHVEEPEDILEHLETIRQAQDEIPGFTAFIPWSYKRDRTALRRSVKNWAGVDAYFRILAFSRIYLDNFDHIQASWFGEGKETGVSALGYGADDFGGTILEENVHRATGFINKANVKGMVDMIRSGGYLPAERNTFYDILRVYKSDDEVFVPELQKNQEADQVRILDMATAEV